MLYDFLSLENMFGRENAAMFLEDMLECFDRGSVMQALDKGLMDQRIICIGPD